MIGPCLYDICNDIILVEKFCWESTADSDIKWKWEFTTQFDLDGLSDYVFLSLYLSPLSVIEITINNKQLNL